MTATPTAAALVAEAKSHIQNLDPQQLEGELRYDDVVLVDIREPDELIASGCITGSIHVPRGISTGCHRRRIPSEPRR